MKLVEMKKNINNIFKTAEVIKLCDKMKYFHEALMVTGSLFDDIQHIQIQDGYTYITDRNGNGFKKVAECMLDRQLETLQRIVEIYAEEKEKLNRIKVWW